MKISNLNSGYFYGLLNEANVLNIQKQFEYGREPDPMSGESRQSWSIEGYLENYIELLGSDETKAAFAKKLRKLLSNDERFLAHVREFEKGMPAWAEKAIKQKQLMFFEPEAELNQSLEHIAHYLGALETDMQSPDGNVAAHAKKEYDGFVKAQDLSLLAKKSNDYFKRGSKKASRSDEGMKQISQYDSWTWYLLKDAEAFKREGQHLQNCIGKNVTPASLKKDGLSLFILRKPNNDSVVAMSIKNKNNEIEELKGKNETVPKPEYMKYVLNFINDPKFKKQFGGFVLGRDAEWNFKNAGYFWIDKLLLTRPQVIAKYIKAKGIGKYPNGTKLVEIEVKSQNKKVTEIFDDVYKELNACRYRSGGGGGSGKDCATVYELRNDSDLPLVSGAVHSKKLESIQRHATLRESCSLVEAVNKLTGGSVKEFVGELIRRKIITSVDDKMERSLFWNERSQINKETGNFDPVTPSGKVDHQQSKKKKVTWEKHTDDKVVAVVRNILEGHNANVGDAKRWSDIFGTSKSPHKGVTVYITKDAMVDHEHQTLEEHGKHYVLVKRADGLLIPVTIDSNQDRLTTSDSANADDKFKRRHFIKAAAGLANAENLKLAPAFAYNNGIVLDKGKYQEFDWNKRAKVIQEDPEILKIDLDGIPPGDRINAINFVLVTGNVRHRNLDELQKIKRDKDHDDIIWRHDLELQLKLDYLIEHGDLKGYERGKSIWSQPSQEETNDWGNHDPDKFLRLIYKGSEPTAIYLVMVRYGKGKLHQVLLVADDKTIFEIDAVTERYGFQNWGDHELVARQLNDFAETQGLSFHAESIGDIGEMKIHNGQVMTEPMMKRSALKTAEEKGEIGGEASEQVEFKDGSTMIQTKAKAGEGWALMDDNRYLGAIVVSDDTILKVAGPDYDLKTDKAPSETKKDITPELVNYAIAAREHFGWKSKAIPEYTIKTGSKEANVVGTASEHGEITDDKTVDHVVNLGLVKKRDVTSRGREGTVKVQLTPLGKQAHKQLDTGRSVNILKLKSKMKVIS